MLLGGSRVRGAAGGGEFGGRVHRAALDGGLRADASRYLIQVHPSVVSALSSRDNRLRKLGLGENISGLRLLSGIFRAAYCGIVLLVIGGTLLSY